MAKYDHKKIEKKWAKKWSDEKIYKTEEKSNKPKCYVLDMFPYPSGEGLHVGHPKGYIATDIFSRYKKMSGYNILHPMGWDAFGLPAENFAIKNKIYPKIAVDKNVARFKEQLSVLGLNYDWDREVNTTDPEYYKWTQWIFLKLLEKGLAYESNEPINWCPSCMTGLANEDLEDGKCERCGSEIEQKPMRQWVLRITDYAERLLEDIEDLDWPKSIKEAQKNWIGKSEGAVLGFDIKAGSLEEKIKVFTTRPDTLFGCTYCVLSPEHGLLKRLEKQIENTDEVRAYIEASAKRTEIERTAEGKEKTGVELKGVKAINPANSEEIPIFIADYVLAHYGTGAIMAVPAHDERDNEFAKKYKLLIINVVTDDVLVNSSEFDGMNSGEAKKAITKKVGGKLTNTYKLQDWVFSRQRYWGEPIPVIHCKKCGVVPVPEKDLPVKLPEVKNYEPTGTGESPLANIDEWVNVECPKCGGKGKRETNTMPQWAGSSWYYLRYVDPENKKELVDSEKEKYWSPVDMYVGGAEHATRHLIYARFWHKFLNDIGAVSYSEPFKKLHHVGLIIGEDGKKMSKRFGNVVNPDEIVELYGADTLRIYEMFMGPFSQSIAWKTESIIGARRFLERVWAIREKKFSNATKELEKNIHKTIKKVGDDIEDFAFNTAISTMMILVGQFEKAESFSQEQFEKLLILLAPFAPHITDELWEKIGHKELIYLEGWPIYEEEMIKDKTASVVVQVNGKVRDILKVTSDITEKEVEKMVLENDTVKKWLKGKEIKRKIYVPNKIFSLFAE